MKLSAPGLVLSSSNPVASAPGDAVSVGTATVAAHGDHRHAREAFGAGESTAVGPDQANGDGTSAALARADHTHSGQGSGTPSTEVFGAAANAGTSGKWARSDHKHALPNVQAKDTNSAIGATVTFTTAFSGTPVVAIASYDVNTLNNAGAWVTSRSTTGATVYSFENAAQAAAVKGVIAMMAN